MSLTARPITVSTRIAAALRQIVWADVAQGVVRTQFGIIAPTYSSTAAWASTYWSIPAGYVQVANTNAQFLNPAQPFGVTIAFRTGASLTNQILLGSNLNTAGNRSIRIAFNSSTTMQVLIGDVSGWWADDTITVPTWTANTDYLITVRYTRNTTVVKDVFIGQNKYAFTGGGSTNYPVAPPNVQLGGEASANSFSGRIYNVVVWDAFPPDAVVSALHGNFQGVLYAKTPSHLWLNVVSGASTLTADAGSFSVTGKSAVFDVSQAANQGTFSETGQGSGFSLSLTADVGSFALAGQVATLTPTGVSSYTMAADVSAFTHAGQAVAFGISQAGDYGSFGETGQDGSLGISLTSANGSFAFTGQDATFIADVSLTLTADPASFSLTGFDVGEYGAPRRQGGIGHKRKQKIVVIEVDGKDYRISEDSLGEFLAAVQKRQEPEEVQKPKRPKKTVAKPSIVEPVSVVIKSAPPEIRPIIQQQVDQTNEKLRQAWQRAIIQQQAEEEDESILWLMVA